MSNFNNFQPSRQVFFSWSINLESQLIINWSLLRIKIPINLQEILLEYWKKTIIDDKRKLVKKATRKKNAKRDRKYLSGRAAKEKDKNEEGRQPRKSIKSISHLGRVFVLHSPHCVSFCRSFNRRLPSTFIIYDAYNCSNLCVCVGVSVCVCVSKSFARICAKAYVVRQTIFDTWPCGVRHVASEMRHAACGTKRGCTSFGPNCFEVHPWMVFLSVQAKCRRSCCCRPVYGSQSGSRTLPGSGPVLCRVSVSRSGSRSSSLLDCTFN